MTWELLIPAIAIGLSFISIGIEFLMHDREKGKQIEFSIKRKQRELKKLQKEKDTKAMMGAQKEIMSLMGQNFKLRMRMMLISFPLFVIVFMVLSASLSVAPLVAGEQNEVGVLLKNDDELPGEFTVSLNSDGVEVIGKRSFAIRLDDKGDQGDSEELWWTVTSTAGEKSYDIEVIDAKNISDSTTYTVEFSESSLLAGFDNSETRELMSGDLEISAIYKPVEINLFGATLNWFIFYIISYFIVTIAISPLKNRILWGHFKGIKYLEKIDREKNEATKE